MTATLTGGQELGVIMAQAMLQAAEGGPAKLAEWTETADPDLAYPAAFGKAEVIVRNLLDIIADLTATR